MKSEPLDTIVEHASKLRMFQEFGEQALGGQSMDEFIKEVAVSYGHLMDLRNLISHACKLDNKPVRNAMMIADRDDIEWLTEAAGS